MFAKVVKIEHEGKTYEVECDGHESILDAAIDAGIENLSYDCKMVRTHTYGPLLLGNRR